MSKIRYIAFVVFAIVSLASCTKSAWMGDAQETVNLRSSTTFVGDDAAQADVQNSGQALSTQTRNGGTTDVVSDDNSGGITDDEDDNGNTKKKTNK